MNGRIEKLQAMLAADGVDGVLYAPSGHMQYFLDDSTFFWQRMVGTGFGLHAHERVNDHFLRNPDRILYIPADGEPTLLTTHEKADEMKNAGIETVAAHYVMFSMELRRIIKGRKIAVGESCDKRLAEFVLEVDNTIEVSDGECYGERLRMIKEPREIEKMRAAAAFTDSAMAKIADALRPGITPDAVKRLIAKIALDQGPSDLSFAPSAIFVREGHPGAETLFSYPPDEPLREGTAIGFDFGFVLDGYCSDYGRSFYCGKNDRVHDAYKALQDAQLHLLSQIKPGVKMNMSYDTLQKRLEPSGFAPYLRRAEPCDIMGHNIGIDVHERPWLRSDDPDAVFMPGMVMCVEPKIWWPGHCYLRCEDMVLITEDGCEALTTFDREYFILPD